MNRILIATILVIMLMMTGMAAAEVETGWQVGTPNTYNGSHVMIDFEDGMANKQPIISPFSSIGFVTIDYPWKYATKGLGMNIYPYGTGAYVVNGESGAWCDTIGNQGKVTFDDDMCHVSVLVSTYSGVEIDAYDRDDVWIANSGRAAGNLRTMNFTRLSIDRNECDIAYVIIHDSGNYWLIDDMIVGYEPKCSEIVIGMDGSDGELCFGMTLDFTSACADQYGYAMDCPVLEWTSSDETVGTIEDGVFTVDKKGTTNITASYGDVMSEPLVITVVPGQKMLAHCQKFIHSEGQDNWNENAYTNKTNPCEYPEYTE